jgi:GNAT superfamily N-acetyltransferase
LIRLPPASCRAIPGSAPLLGRFAVARRHQGKGYGRFLLAEALFWAAERDHLDRRDVDAEDDTARRFYAGGGFLPFPDQPMTLF